MQTYLLPCTLLLGALALSAPPVRAANIILIDSNHSFSNSPQGAQALYAFQKAANYWNKTLSNNATIRIDIGYAALGSNVLGSTSSNSNVVTVADIYHGLQSTGSSSLDSVAVSHLPQLANGTDLSMRVNAYIDPASKFGVDPNAPSRISSGGNTINQYLDVNSAVLKAMGMHADYSGSYASRQTDAQITFSSDFAFDYNPADGIGPGRYDFTAVAVHELGHALGFVSGADVFDIVGGNGPLAPAFNAGAFGSTNIDDFAIGSTLDLFRYGAAVDHGMRYLNWGANKTAFFSIDGGASIFNQSQAQQEAAFFSTGAYNGDGHQASHWHDNIDIPDLGGLCFLSTGSVGIMDPTFAACAEGAVTQNDLAAFDAMGWNLNQNILNQPGYRASSADIYAMEGLAQAVPEPASYAMLLAGLGIAGGLARLRNSQQA